MGFQKFYELIIKFKIFLSIFIIFVLSIFFNIKISDVNFLFNIDRIFYPIEYSSRFLKEFSNVKKENLYLKLMNQQLLIENTQLNNLLKTKFEISGKNPIKVGNSYKIIPVTPISFYPDLRGDYLIIDKGNDDGIKKNMGVLDFNGVVGKIVKTTKKSSLIQLVSDPDFRVSVYNRKSGAFGILKTNDGMSFYLDFINDDEKFYKNDTLLTSGLGGLFPKDIPVCYISDIKNEKFGSFRKIYVKLLAKIRKPKEYFVIENKDRTEMEW